MRLYTLIGALATIVLTALPAAAQTTTGAAPDPLAFSSGVLWAAGIAGFIGFMLGSFNPTREYASSEFDFPGALVVGLGAAALVGGIALRLSTNEWLPAAYGIGFGALMLVTRWFSLRPAPRPKGGDLTAGVTRGEGADARAKFKAAERLYNKASFNNGGSWYASRGRDWRFNESGMSQDMLAMLIDAASRPRSEVFDIMLLLVKELPGEPGAAAVIVVRGGAELVKVKADGNSMVVPGFDKPIPTSSIRGAVGYAWRSR